MAAPTPPSSSSVLFQPADGAILLLDIPRSLEESQVPRGHPPSRRILSAPPPAEPFPTPEPGDAAGAGGSQAAQIADLMTGAAVRDALEELKSLYRGPFHAPRALPPREGAPEISAVHLVPSPPGAEYLCGSIRDTREAFLDSAPRFDLIVLDPPWPNRSARRKTKGYATAATLEEIRQLLVLVPVSSHLNPDGLVAVWITNKPSIMDLLTSPTGVLASWGLELVAEWTWLKVAASGEPLYDVESRWRKPWEKLLIARRRGSRAHSTLKPKVIVAVPDVHSRKPNLRGPFQHVLGDDYRGLEVFSRNLTAGWWSWGDETLRFQEAQCWTSNEAHAPS